MVAGFGMLMRWHQTNYKARLVVKVYLKDDEKIPQAMTMTMGNPPRARSFSFQVPALCSKDIIVLADEDPVPKNSPMHPLPFEAARWMGP